MSAVICREAERPEVAQLVRERALVTVTGPPGVGKSHLARAVAADLETKWRLRTAVVDLSGVSDSRGAWGALGRTLSIARPARPSTIGAVKNALRELPTVLVLDNCDRMIPVAAQICEELLTAPDDTRILATTREPFGIPGEKVQRLLPLEVPAEAEEIDLDDLARCPSVGLFVALAREASPGFVLTSDNAPDVAALCRHLDGIPRAIGLAASMLESSSVQEIAAGACDREGGRAGPGAGAAPPVRSFDAAVRESHDVLSDGERSLLRRLSIFRGEWVIEDMVEVCPAGAAQPEETFDLLATLVSKSMVVSETSGSYARYHLLETARRVGLEQLRAAGELTSVRAAHTQWYVKLAEQAEAAWCGANRDDWLTRLRIEQGNLREVLAYTRANGETSAFLRLAGALAWFWWLRGRPAEGRDWLSLAVASTNGVPTSVRAKALRGLGFSYLKLGDPESAVPALQESLALSRQVGDGEGSARSLLLLGRCAEHLAGPRHALGLFEESAAWARAAGDDVSLTAALAESGRQLASCGEAAAAGRLFDEAVALCRPANPSTGLVLALSGHGRLALQGGDRHRAGELTAAALRTADELGDDEARAIALCDLATLEMTTGRLDRAKRALTEAVELGRKHTSPLVVVAGLDALGGLASSIGHRSVARRHFEHALEMASAGGFTLASSMCGLARVVADEGDLPAAATLLQRARDAAASSGRGHDLVRCWNALGQLRTAEANGPSAVEAHRRAITVATEHGHVPDIIDSLEALAVAFVGDESLSHATLILAAASAQRAILGFTRAPRDVPVHDRACAALRVRLADDFDRLWAEGAALSFEAAAAMAGTGDPRTPAAVSGWESLTRAERKVADLVPSGLTNRQIAEQLYISRHTVQSHLARIFVKLGVRSRVELATAMFRERTEPDNGPDG